jgi:hypothetical protein
MSRSDPQLRPRSGPVAALATLLLAVLVLGVAAPRAGAVAALYAEVAEDMASEYAEAACEQDKPECTWGYGSRCRQQGKFQVTCWAVKDYSAEPSEGLRELWDCKREIRYTAEKRPYYEHKRVIKHRHFVGAWVCEPHHKVRDY